MLNLGGLDYRPADWDPVDSLAWLKAMAWDLRGNMQDEIDRVLTADSVGEDALDELYPAYPFDEHRAIVDQGAVIDDVFEQDATDDRHPTPRRPPWAADRRPGVADALDAGRATGWTGCRPGSAAATGSAATPGSSTASTPRPGRRSWPTTRTSASRCPGCGCRSACTAGRSATTARSTWRASASPGVPGVIIGHNDDIAWGFTNLGPDVTDLFVERVEGDEWRYDRRLRPMATREEKIAVADGPDVTITVRSTDHGPLISDVEDQLADVADDAPMDRPPLRAEGGVRRRPGVDGAAAQRDRRRDLRAQPGRRLGRVPGRGRRLRGAGAEPRVRRPARATSATRRRG